MHRGERSPCLWSLRQYSIEKTSFQPPELTNRQASSLQPTAVALTPCGNFGVIGYCCGSLHRFNVQSGLHRREYRRASHAAHDRHVIGCYTDRFNQKVISAGGDGCLRVWRFKSGELDFEISLNAPIHALDLHRGNALCALATDDLLIHVMDCDAQRRVRSFKGHTNRITNLQMSSDGRWLLAASMDCSLRVYDIPSAHMIHVRAAHVES